MSKNISKQPKWKRGLENKQESNYHKKLRIF